MSSNGGKHGKGKDGLPQFWFPHAPEGYAVGDVMHHDTASDNMQVRLHVSASEVKTITFHGSIAKPMNPDNLNGVDDNTQLMHLHEPSLLHNLRCRYAKDLIYTYTGYILIAVNPYKKLACYGDQVMQAYRGKSIGLLPPHLYAMADRAFRSMKVDGTSQSIMISGESGSGKTESAKVVMKYLAMCGTPKTGKVGATDETRRVSEQLGSLSEKVLDCNPILETFGNAKTVMNHNSSRFGKFTRIHFDERNWLVGADIVTYLLEKSRTVVQSPEERNYHCFYQLFAGLATAEKAALRLTNPEDYHYLKGGMIRVDAIDDEAAHTELIAAMRTIGITVAQQHGIDVLLAALLHVGNIGFRAIDEDSCDIGTPDAVAAVAELLKVGPNMLEEALTKRTMRSLSNSIYKIPLKAQEAAYSRDTFAKAVYAKLFDWLVRCVNTSLLTKASTRAFIGVLDIFGFEEFETNSFEQLCINFANETLQAHFNSAVFRQEQEIYLREAIVFNPIEEPSNQACINMLANRPPDVPVGLFALLDEQCKLPKCTHKTFVEKLFEQNKEAMSDGVLATVARGGKLMPNEGFVVRHFAGHVAYTADGFLQKNNNSLHADLELVLLSSEQPLLAEMVAAELAAAAATEKPAKGGRLRSGGTQPRFSSVSHHFCNQLNSLLVSIKETSSTFVRCINPNTIKQHSAFAGGHVLHQLRCSGMMEALRLMHEGFPTRCPYDALYDRYKDIMPRSIATLDSPSFCEILLLALGLDKADYQLGITKVFFRAGKLAFLDDLTGSDYKELAPDIANKVRRWLIKKRWRRHTIAVVAVLRMTRFLEELRLLRRLERAAKFMLLMATRPKLSLKRARQIRTRNAATRIQARARVLVATSRFHRKLWATYLMQRLARGHLARQKHGAPLAEIRARQRAEAEARKAAMADEEKARQAAEVERIKAMARSNASSVNVNASKYATKNRLRTTALADTTNSPDMSGGGSGGVVVASDEFESRMLRMETAIHELPALKERVKELEDALSKAHERIDDLEKGGPARRADGGSSRSRHATPATASTQAVLAQAVSRQQARARGGSGAQAGQKSWGFLDLLGLTQGAAAGAPATGPISKKLVAAGGARAAVNSVIPPPSDALAVLQAASAAIGTHFAQAAVAGSSKSVELLGDDQKNKEIAVLVRGQLCTALSRVLLHGFKSFKLIGRYHIWDFVQHACEATHERLRRAGGNYSAAERTMTGAVVEVNSSGVEGPANNPNIKFRSFVCSGLNHGLLHEWIAVLTADAETMGKFYETWAFVRSSEQALPQMMEAIRPLASHKYTLSLDYETSRWDLH